MTDRSVIKITNYKFKLKITSKLMNINLNMFVVHRLLLVLISQSVYYNLLLVQNGLLCVNSVLTRIYKTYINKRIRVTSVSA